MKEKTFKIIGTFFLSVFFAIFLFLIYTTMNYPIKYKEEIIKTASKYNIDSYIIASVINVESSFVENSVSNKGAVGLMQILPSTGTWLAEKLKIENFSTQMLYQPQVNIEIGTYYLRYLLEKFLNLNCALCAYNAGEGTVSSWLNNEEYSKDGKSLSQIPYKETRDYLEKVQQNFSFYKFKV